MKRRLEIKAVTQLTDIADYISGAHLGAVAVSTLWDLDFVVLE